MKKRQCVLRNKATKQPTLSQLKHVGLVSSTVQLSECVQMNRIRIFETRFETWMGDKPFLALALLLSSLAYVSRNSEKAPLLARRPSYDPTSDTAPFTNTTISSTYGRKLIPCVTRIRVYREREGWLHITVCVGDWLRIQSEEKSVSQIVAIWSIDKVLSPTLSLSSPLGPITLSNRCFPTCESTADSGSSRRYTSEEL